MQNLTCCCTYWTGREEHFCDPIIRQTVLSRSDNFEIKHEQFWIDATCMDLLAIVQRWTEYTRWHHDEE